MKTGTMKELKRTASTVEWWGAHFSSDGRYLAYQMAADGGNRTQIFLRDLQSQTETALVEREVGRIVNWGLGDTKVLFTSHRTGANGLWAIAVRDGKSSGEPEIVKANVGEDFEGEQVTRDGRVFYMDGTRSTYSAYVAAVNLETGEITSQPHRVTDRFPGAQTKPVWSKDGQKLMIALKGTPHRYDLASGPPRDRAAAG